MTETNHRSSSELLEGEYLPSYLLPFVFPDFNVELPNDVQEDFNTIFALNEEIDDRKKRKMIFQRFIGFLDKYIVFVCFPDTEEIIFYDPNKGIYLKDGENLIRRITRKFFPTLSVHAINDIIDKVRTLPGVYKSRDLFNQKPMVALKNVTYDIENQTVKSHSA